MKRNEQFLILFISSSIRLLYLSVFTGSICIGVVDTLLRIPLICLQTIDNVTLVNAIHPTLTTILSVKHFFGTAAQAK